MKKFLPLGIFFILLIISNTHLSAQTKGLIYKKAAGSGQAVLDPNVDGYSSETNQGFFQNDETESEIPYTPLPSVGASEPDSDLGPGPDCKFTDLVKSEDNNTIYTYMDGENLMFRFRLGGTAENSKGYSILIDTDQKFGASDPNSIPGNPGFEIEVVLRTNFGVGLYDVDGTVSPGEIGDAVTDRPYDNFAQKSIALSEICGDDDYFYDFYIPFADITAAFPSITVDTPLRMVGNTVINPKAATGNNGISDLGGIDDTTGITDGLWEELINVFPPTSVTEIGSGATLPPRAACPSITGPIAVGATSITGTSSEVDGTTIEVFRDEVSQGTTSVSSGSWTLSGLIPAEGNEVFSATAKVSEAVASSTGTSEKSESYSDCNETTVGATCSSPPFGFGTANGGKTFTGSSPATGDYDLKIYNADGSRLNGLDENPKGYPPGDWSWVFTAKGSKIPAGVYYFTITEPGKCESSKAEFCYDTTSTSSAPVISNTPILESDTSITGTATNGAIVTLIINGEEQKVFNATDGNWNFDVSGLSQGDEILIRSVESGSCKAETSATVSSQSATPIVTGEYCLSGGMTVNTVNGVSSEDAGSEIKIYSSLTEGGMANLEGTTTVKSNGSWTATGLNILIGRYISATAQTSGEIVSEFSNEVLVRSKTPSPNLSITSDPIVEGDATITGEALASTSVELTIQLYMDGVAIEGATATVNQVVGVASVQEWTITGLDTPFNKLYAGGEATVTVTSPTVDFCESDPSNGVTVQCKQPASQVFGATTSTTVCQNETITFQVNDTEENIVYELIDQTNTGIGPALLGTGSSISLTTFGLKTSVTDVRIRAQKIGIVCDRIIIPSIPVTVNPLPAITLGTNPIISDSETSAFISYTNAINNPVNYVLDFDSTANSAGFVDISTAISLPTSPIEISVPGSATEGIYNGIIRVLNPTTGCFSENIAFTITIDASAPPAVNFIIDAINDIVISENTSYTGPTPVLSGDTPVGKVTYTLGGEDAGSSSINADSGIVSMVARDFENPEDDDTNNTYELIVIATDTEGNSDSEAWAVQISNENENPLITTNAGAPTHEVDYAENSTGNVIDWDATDVDGETENGGGLTYSLSGSDAALFNLDTDTGELTFKVAPDFEGSGDNEYEAIVTVTDGTLTDTQTLTVNVTDVTETADFTINTINNATVDENSKYTSVTPGLTGDAPIGSVTYTISGADASLFEVNANTGVVTLTEKDFENPADANTDNVYEVTLTATDDDGNTDSEAWTVAVQNIAETVSFSIDPIEDDNVVENSAYTSETPSITGGPIGTVTYTLSGDDAADFTINSSNGVVSMIARDFENPVDVNTDNSYEVTITATDSDGNTDSESWSVSVTDVIETADFTINSINNATIDENNKYTSVTPGLAGDAPIGSVTYTISGADAALFEVNEDTGVVTMTEKDFENPADANTDNVYEVTLTATDDDGNTDSESWSVSVQNIAEAVSFSIDPIADASVAENTAYTSETPSITGGPIGTVTYILSGDDAADFTINASTGVVSMVARDFENPVDTDSDNSYEVTITAADSDGNTDSESWSVTVTDQTEAADFTINTINNATVDENSKYTSVTPGLAGDAPIGSVTYTISGADASLFEVNANTGVVTMTEKDFENPADANTDNVYEVTLTATDDDGNTDSEAWTVAVQNVSEAVSFSIDPIEDDNVAENTAYTSETPSITGGPIGTVTYSLSGDDAAEFTINSSNGVVSMIARDFENPVDTDSDNSYEVTITATDSDGNTDSEAWSVSVTDVTETADFTINTINNATIDENSKYTSVTPGLAGDAPIGSVTYTISGADAALFEVDADTGVVTMTEKDFENPADANTDNVYEVTLTATDDDGNTDSESWSVSVQNIAEAASFTIDAIADDTVVENTAYTSETPSITGGPIGSVTYSLSGDDAADFTINASTGVVSMVARDFEAPVDTNTDNIYEVSITATDSDGNTDSESWSVSVTDQTETADFTIDAIDDATVNENSAYTGPTPTLAGDTPIGSVTYTITGADAALFEVDENTGVVTMTEKDFENPADANTDNVYEVTLTATDADGNTDSEAWTVSVQNIAETVSFSIDPIADASVAENNTYTSETPSITGGPIGTVTYSLSGDDAADFTINSSKGVVSMIARDFENPVDTDTDNSYEVTITATDSDGNTDSESWSVNVTDVNETADFTINTINNATIDENSKYTSVTPGLAGDAPIGSVTYTISGADASLFEVNANTGVVTMTEKDFENPADANTDNVYEVTLTATDADGNTDSEAWTVAVQNVSEAVSFSIDPIENDNVAENTAYTSETPSITGGPIGTVTYSLSGDDAADFTINSSNGVVSMIARDFENPVDVNTDNSYEVTITATDSDGNTDSESWSVSVTDITETADFTINTINNATIDENSKYTSVTPGLAGDAPIGSVTYTISGADAALFEVNANTGVVTMTEKDFENPADANTDNVYEVTLTATDADGNTDSEAWTVAVQNVSEAVSFSIDPIADASVAENTAYTSETPSITGGPIGTVTYSLSGDDAADFTINSSNGVVSMIARDFENPVDTDSDNNYELTITATDSDGNTDSESWSVRVTDVTETADFTINTINNATIDENSKYTSVTPSLAGDAPIGSVTYTISGADAALFEVNADTGVVTLTEKDFENPADANTDNSYEVTLTATDADGNTDSESWTVSVENVNELTTINDDTPTTNEDTVVDIDVVANDTDVDDKSAVTSVTQPANGAVSINDNGTVKYIPDADFNGEDTFSYTNSEGNTGTVTVTVNSIDDEAIYTIADPKPINQYENDDVLATVADADGEIVNAELTDGNLPAGVILNENGSLSVENADLLEAGDYSFEITTTDENGGITSQTIVLSFGEDSDAEAIYTIADAKPINEYENDGVLATVADADGEIVNAELTDGNLPPGVILNADGSLSVQNAELLEAGDYSFEITTTDENGGITSQTIVLSFGEDSDSEAIYTITDAKPINQYENDDVLATVADADGEIVNAELTDGNLPVGTSLNADGSIEVSNADLLEAGDYSFEITTTDENGGITSQTIVLSFGEDSDT
ncbi:Ig-like domain-containing protein, partial [Christiangramia forsetii]